MNNAGETLLHRWFQEVWNEGRVEAIDEMFHPEAIGHGLADANGQEPRGPAAFRTLFHSFRGAFPDMHIEVEDTVCQADKIAARCRVTGTHHGWGLGVPPSGRPVNFTGMCIVRIAGGQIMEAWNTFDFAEMYRQIGAGSKQNA